MPFFLSEKNEWSKVVVRVGSLHTFTFYFKHVIRHRWTNLSILLLHFAGLAASLILTPEIPIPFPSTSSPYQTLVTSCSRACIAPCQTWDIYTTTLVLAVRFASPRSSAERGILYGHQAKLSSSGSIVLQSCDDTVDRDILICSPQRRDRVHIMRAEESSLRLQD